MGGKRVIRILQATVTNDSGGLTWYICQNYRFIDKSKIQFDFITYDDKLEFKNEFEKIGANFYQIPKPIHFFSYVKKLFEIQKKRQYEIIHLNLSFTNYSCQNYWYKNYNYSFT
jgi:glycosyltransferase EpsF